MDWTQIIIAIIGALTGGGLTMAAKFKISKARDKLDLIKELNSEMADKTKKIRELNEEILRLKDQCHDSEMRLLSSRCDLIHCSFREPPLPWTPKAVDADADGIPDIRPVPKSLKDTNAL